VEAAPENVCPRFRNHLNIASVLFDNALNCVEPQPSPLSNTLGRKEWFKDMRFSLGRNARTIICDFDDYASVLAKRSDPKLALPCHGIDGVIDEVRPNLIQFATVGTDEKRSALVVALHRYAVSDLMFIIVSVLSKLFTTSTFCAGAWSMYV